MLAACAHSETSVLQVLSPSLWCVHTWMFVFGDTLAQNMKDTEVFIYFMFNLYLEDKSIRVSAY